jgi:hypothetical protein
MKSLETERRIVEHQQRYTEYKSRTVEMERRDAGTELVFLNPCGDQESMPRHQFRQPL